MGAVDETSWEIVGPHSFSVGEGAMPFSQLASRLRRTPRHTEEDFCTLRRGRLVPIAFEACLACLPDPVRTTRRGWMPRGSNVYHKSKLLDRAGD